MGFFSSATGVPEGYRKEYAYHLKDDQLYELYTRTEKNEERRATPKDIDNFQLPAILGDNPPKRAKWTIEKSDEELYKEARDRGYGHDVRNRPDSEEANCGDRDRFQGYFPIFSLATGLMDMCNALETVYSRVILQCNEATEIIKTDMVKNSYSNRVSIGTTAVVGKSFQHKKIMKLNLSAEQKMSIVARCVLVWMRGLITFCQLGIIFAPFDAIANRYYKKA